MSISDKLTTIAENVDRVFTSGRYIGTGEGIEIGRQEGYRSGYDVGLNDGHAAGFTEGHTAGVTEGYSNGYDEGYAKGGSEGYETGYSQGKTDGVSEGYADGYAKGDADGYQNGLGVGFDEGKQVEYDRFWDALQNYGRRTDYSHEFREGFTDANFYPKYDILAKNISNMFVKSKVTDLKDRLAECGVKFDTSGTSSIYYFAQASSLTTCPAIGNTSVTNTENSFTNCAGLVSVDKITVSTTESCRFTNTFGSCTNLVDIRFNEGYRPINLNLKDCKKLSRASLENIVSSVADDFTTTITVSKAAVEAAFPDLAEWNALCNTKSNLTVTEV